MIQKKVKRLTMTLPPLILYSLLAHRVDPLRAEGLPPFSAGIQSTSQKEGKEKPAEQNPEKGDSRGPGSLPGSYRTESLWVPLGEVVAVQRNKGSIRISSLDRTLHLRTPDSIRKYFLETHPELILKDRRGKESGEFRCTRVEVERGEQPGKILSVMLYGYFQLLDTPGEEYLTMGYTAGLYHEQTGYIPPVDYQPPPRETLKLIRHPVDRKSMVLVPWDFAVIGQGDDPTEDNFNPFFYERDSTIIPKVQAFYMDKHEVTNREYYRFCRATGHSLPPSWKAGGGLYPPGTEDFPVTVASYEDAEAYARWTGKRLPTEVEWEMAARGGLRTLQDGSGPESLRRSPPIYPFGETFDPNLCNTFESGRGGPIPVTQEKDVSPYGIYGMCGNAREWTSSWYRPYPGHRFQEKHMAGRLFRVIRGGSYYQNRETARSDSRDYGGFPSLQEDRSAGFRLVMDVP